MNRLEKTLKITPDNAVVEVLKNEYIGWLFLKDGVIAQLIPVLIKWLLSLMVK
jgi:hypothetical protein